MNILQFNYSFASNTTSEGFLNNSDDLNPEIYEETNICSKLYIRWYNAIKHEFEEWGCKWSDIIYAMVRGGYSEIHQL